MLMKIILIISGIFESPKTQPSAPASVSLQAVDPDSIQVTIAPPSDNGGAVVTQYNIEWDVLGSAAYATALDPSLSLLYSQYEVQSIRTADTAYGLGGYFYVSFGGISSGKISVTATEEDMITALESIPSVGQVLVTREEEQATFGYQWSITFLNSEWYAGGVKYYEMPLLLLTNVEGTQTSAFNGNALSSAALSTFTGTAGTITASRLVAAMSGFEQQSLTVQTSNGLITGTFAISSGLISTSFLDYTASVEEIRAALLLLPIGDVIVRRSNMASGQGFTLFVIFVEMLGNNAELAVDVKNMRSSDGSATVTATFTSPVAGSLPVLGSTYYNSTIVDVMDETMSLVYTIPNLSNGLHYYVRVSAFNGAGASYGASINGFPILIETSKAPTQVGDVVLTALSDNSLTVSWQEPADVGGSPISSYLLEIDSASAIKEVQVVNINSTSSKLSGSFSLQFGGFSTSVIPYDASASRMEAAIESLASVGNVQVVQKLSQSGSTSYSISWTVTFLDNVGPLGLISVSANNLVGSSVVIRAYRILIGTAPTFTGGSVGIFQKPLQSLSLMKTVSVHRITVNSTSSDLSGTFYVVNGGETSSPISVYSTAEEMKNRLESMLTISAVEVSLTVQTLTSGIPRSNYGATWTVTFLGTQYRSLLVSTDPANTIAEVVATGGSLTGSSAIVGVERMSPGEILPSSAVISGLVMGMQYVARVTASNGPFNGLPSLSMIATAPKVSVPSIPLTVYMDVLSDTQIAIFWNTPLLSGGVPITGYSVSWDTNLNFGSDAMTTFVTTGTGALTSFVITGLKPMTAYAVRVAAYNSQGYSPFVLALPQGTAEVISVAINTQETFTLSYSDGIHAVQTTTTIPIFATESQVQSALQALASIRSVVVSREYHTTLSSTYAIAYRITFIDADFLTSNTLAVTSASNTAVVTTLNQGISPTSNYITTMLSESSPPENVTVAIVSNTELGVTWLPPTHTGGLVITSYIVEWDTSEFFIRQNNNGDTGVFATTNFAIVDATTPIAKYLFQISGLDTLQGYYVRVSAFNSLTSAYGGYSKATSGFPLGTALACNTMPIHCLSTPASQILYLPVTPVVDLSALQVANRLDIVWTQPKVDVNGFDTSTGLPHTPIVASAYRVETSTQQDFSNATVYDIPMLLADGSPKTCSTPCAASLGVSIQNVTISGNSEMLTGGSFALLYIGEQSQELYMGVQQGSSSVRLFNAAVTVGVNDFLLIGSQRYQIGSILSQDTVVLTKNFTGGFTDILKGFYLKDPGSLPVLPYDATAAAVELYLQAQLTDLYPLYLSTNFQVSRQTLTYGFSWLVTFTGEMFQSGVEHLFIISNGDGSTTNIVTSPFTLAGSSTGVVRTVETVVPAGTLVEGVAVFVRIAAINSVGLGPFANFVTSNKGLAVGSIVPRSPPGLPESVEVYAVASSIGDLLKVTWAEGETYGSPIVQYTIETRDTSTSVFTNVILLAKDFGGNSTYVQFITVTPGVTYEVRVRAYNDLGAGGPAWFQFIGLHDITQLNTKNDFNTGAQRATPTCELELEACLESTMYIVSRGVPGPSLVLIPRNPTIDSARSFTQTSAMVYFAVPVINGLAVDMTRVEWALDHLFKDTKLSGTTSLAYFNITGLTEVNM
jgi:hypothetical protein